MKKIRNIFLWLLAALFVLVMAGTILAKVFEDKVISFIINEINKSLSTEISVKDVSFSLIRKFPDATVIFNGVAIKSFQKNLKGSFPDTLLSANRIMLSFNVLEIFKQEYLLKNILISNGFINILINNQGIGNYNIWQGGSEANMNQFQIDLQQVRLTDFDLVFQNDATATTLCLYAEKADLKGRFKGAQFTVESNLQGMISNYSRDGITYIRDQEVFLDLILDKQDDRFRINKAALILDKIHLAVQGEVFQDPETSIDLQIKGQDIKLGTIINYLPVLKNKIPSDLSYHGQFDILLGISGSISKTKMPHVEAAFKIEDAGIASRKNKVQIDRINLSGIYSNGQMNNAETTVLLVSNCSASYRNSNISGSIKIRNLIEPEVECSLESQMDLQDIEDLFGIKSMQLSGRIHSTLSMRGRQAGVMKFKKEDFNNFDYKGFIKIQDMKAARTGMPPFIKDLNADVSINKYLFINKLTGDICNNELIISGRVDNFYDYLIDRSGNLWADLDMYSENFILDSVFLILNGLAPAKEHGNALPDDLFVNLQFWFNRFSFSTFNGTNITGDLFYRPGILTVNRFNGSTLNGSMQTKGMLELHNDTNYIIRCNSVIDNVKIKDLFSSFNNFGQQFIQDRHLRGDLSGSIDFYGEFDNNFKVIRHTILADGDLIIRNGELIGFEPMEKLSKFIDLEELSDIHFSDLQNEVFISKGKVIIPQMEINSSAINLTASGIHGFDNYYNYKIKLSLSELLSKKIRSGRQPDPAFGIIEDDSRGRTSVYLSIDGTPDEMKVSYDKEAALKGFKDKMNQEKTLLKDIIREEFGNMEKDTSKLAVPEKEDKSKFFLHWEESEEPLKKQDSSRVGKKEKFMLEWEEDTLYYDNHFNHK